MFCDREMTSNSKFGISKDSEFGKNVPSMGQALVKHRVSNWQACGEHRASLKQAIGNNFSSMVQAFSKQLASI